MKKIASLVAGALLLSASGAYSASLFSVQEVPSTPSKVPAFLPLASMEEALESATNSITYIGLVVYIETDPGNIWNPWQQINQVTRSWNGRTSNLALGDQVEVLLRQWLGESDALPYLVEWAELNGTDPALQKFKVGVVCRASGSMKYNSKEYFNSEQEFRLQTTASRYALPEHIFRHELQPCGLTEVQTPGGNFNWNQIYLMIPGLARVVIREQSGLVIDSLDYPDAIPDVLSVKGNEILYFPSRYVGTRTQGTVSLYYLDGTERIFNLADGRESGTPQQLLVKMGKSIGGGEFLVTIEGPATGRPVRLEVSQDLESWNTIAIIANFTGPRTFRVTTDGPAGFFRAGFDTNGITPQGIP